MDRKEFLAYCGAALLAVIGVSGLLRALTHPPALAKRQSAAAPEDGYGGGVYGGRR